MNFNIVEGDYSDITDENYDDFKQDYLHSNLKSEEVRKKYGLSKKQYAEVSSKIREEHGLLARPYARAKHFYSDGPKWHITKTTNKKRTYFGSLKRADFSEKDMEEIIEHCKELLWDIKKCEEYIRRLKHETNGD